MQVKLDWFVALLVVMSLAVVSTKPTLSQSVSVQVPGGRLGSIGANTPWPPNSMTADMRRWEKILDRVYPSRFNGTFTGRELVNELNRLGLPMILSMSARDDSLDYFDEIKSLPLPNSALRTRLRAGLEEKNATICFAENRIGIISLDDAEDSKYFMTVTYDVTALVERDPYELVDSIMQSVDPDEWMETGQGLGTIGHYEVHGRELITISQSYAIHRNVQRMLIGLHRLSGSYPSSTRSNRVSVPSGSRTVRYPRRTKIDHFSNGGVFRVPDSAPLKGR